MYSNFNDLKIRLECSKNEEKVIMQIAQFCCPEKFAAVCIVPYGGNVTCLKGSSLRGNRNLSRQISMR